eukprot:TRINITY_DN294_c0_g1_i6.p1 TRINITY_DN294_c0_g1~~TRINITY_DN294_c0_g1_i6.p1  ORF type:complete len:351 (-),score=91.84 TRINITY_DN294_c0_g1_i6:294-1346(-)
MSENKTEKKLKSEDPIKKTKSSSKENAEQKKKIEQELEEESSEDEETVKVSRVGYINCRLKKKDWKAVYCVLIGGSFYYYKSSSDQQPKGTIDLSAHKVVVHPSDAKDKRKFVFSVQKGDEQMFVGSCANEQELNSWTTAITANLEKEKAEPPTATAQKAKKKKSLISRAQNKAATTTATSTLGKKVMKAIINDETTTLINALKHIVKAQSHDAKKADELEKNIIKIAVKAFLLIENKILTADDFLVADKPLRDAFELMVKVFNGRGRVKDDKITAALTKVEELLKKAEEIITNLLAPHLTSKNMLRISSTFSIIANSEFLNSVFRNDGLEGDLDKLIDAMEYYTQFHYH